MPHYAISAIMVVFHAHPHAVIAPIIKCGIIAGNRIFLNNLYPLMSKLFTTSLKLAGIELMPDNMLKIKYHCMLIIRRMLSQIFGSSSYFFIKYTHRGNIKFAGKEDIRSARGCAIFTREGLRPIYILIGNHINIVISVVIIILIVVISPKYIECFASTKLISLDREVKIS